MTLHWGSADYQPHTDQEADYLIDTDPVLKVAADSDRTLKTLIKQIMTDNGSTYPDLLYVFYDNEQIEFSLHSSKDSLSQLQTISAQ